MTGVPSNAAAEPFARAADGTVTVGLPAPSRDVLASMLTSLTAVITDPDADTDPAVRALFPNPHPDDRDRQADWAAYAKPGLVRDRLEAIGTVEATLSRDTITDGEAYTWMTVLNSLRLVLAARLGIADQPEPADDADSGTIGGYRDFSRVSPRQLVAGGGVAGVGSGVGYVGWLGMGGCRARGCRRPVGRPGAGLAGALKPPLGRRFQRDGRAGLVRDRGRAGRGRAGSGPGRSRR